MLRERGIEITARPAREVHLEQVRVVNVRVHVVGLGVLRIASLRLDARALGVGIARAGIAARGITRGIARVRVAARVRIARRVARVGINTVNRGACGTLLLVPHELEPSRALGDRLD